MNDAIGLPLPLPLLAIKIALVAAFVLHIVFVNLMVGGTMLTLHAHYLGRKDPAMAEFARRLLDCVTVHKSLAVVLGVGPLLLISLAYTVPFYTASILIAPAWLSVLWLVTLAFSLLYAYKFGWERWRLAHPRWHAACGIGAGLCFLVIPLIYLTNTQLMLDRVAMARQPDFFGAMLHVGNVLPRYVHFMLASLAVAGFWVALWWGRQAKPMDEALRGRIVGLGIRWALFPTALQFLAGPLVLFTLPAGGLTAPMVGVLAIGILAGALSIFAMLDALREPSAGRAAGSMKRAAAFLLVTVVCMATTRHLVREALLARPANNSLSAVASHGTMLVKICKKKEGRS